MPAEGGHNGTHTANEPLEANVAAATPDNAARTPRPGSTLAQMFELIEGEACATIAETLTATSWHQHTVRGALAGSIIKKLGRTLTSEKVEGRWRVYW